MMSNQSPAVLLGGISVATTTGRGWTPDELADRAIEKILYVGKESHPAIRDQAVAFRGAVRSVIKSYLEEAVRQDRATIAIRLREAGHSDLVHLLGD
jgi:hypothetical protein